MAQTVQQVNQCPVCGQITFLSTETKYDMADILMRWEREVPMTFKRTVWEEYTEPNSKKVTLYDCSNCNFKMFYPPLIGSEDFYVDIMSNWEYQKEKWEFFRTIDLLSRDAKPKRILDVGCGSGFFLDLLRSSKVAGEFAGYEVNSVVADQARLKGHTIFSGSISDILSSAKPFDVVCAFQILEHLDNPIRFLVDVKNLMSSDGLLFIGVPNASGPIRHFPNSITELPPHHLSYWSESVFKKGMPRVGLSIVKIENEPLPNYLWESYLPVMIKKGDILHGFFGKIFNNVRNTHGIIKLLTLLKIKWLVGVQGHTMLVVLRKT
jgi:2-polyprenyl-3-methyl-5-hydroxy-6-metoxy-1,4-benzoquinol methylase